MKLQEYIAGIEARDIRVLSKAITMAESRLPDQYEQAVKLIENLNIPENTQRIGITGTPGVGKSTFINALGKLLIQSDPSEKIAVLSVDPSSSISQGSILGDKTRMNYLANHPQVYIRPSASGLQAGGLAKNTRLSILLCEAAGYQKILIESVGVGQGETEISKLSDLFILLLNPGGGDELQGIKRGIVEMADMLIVNKADGSSLKTAQTTAKEYAMAQDLMPQKDHEQKPKVLLCSAELSEGLEAVNTEIIQYFSNIRKSGWYSQNREEQQTYWTLRNFQDLILQKLNIAPEKIKAQLQQGALPERIALNLFHNLK